MTTFHELPLPNSEALHRSDLLTQKIRQEINKKGYIPFSTFMEMALYDVDFGYYYTNPIIFGKQGDFITAAEISPLYAQCFAEQCKQIFENLNARNLLELGAGTGKFANDLLITLDAQGFTPKQYYIYEISPLLRQRQQAFLRSACPLLFDRFIWLDTLPSHFEGIIIANEVLDALPVSCFQIEDDEIRERDVTWQNNQLAWQTNKPTASQLIEYVSTIKHLHAIPSTYYSEVSLHLPDFI